MSELDLLREISSLRKRLDLLITHGNVGADGWIPACETWTRTGANTFTLSGQGDRRTIYQVGTKLRYKQGGAWQYQVVIANAYAAPTTTVTTTGGSDYNFAVGAITDNYYSYAENPQGWPDWFNWTPTLVGFNPVPGTIVARFFIQGRHCHATVSTNNGTSNANNFTISLPVTARTVANHQWNGTANATDNGVFLTIPARVVINSAAVTMILQKDWSGAVWAAANGKGCTGLAITYEI